jgi:hypothetical protein
MSNRSKPFRGGTKLYRLTASARVGFFTAMRTCGNLRSEIRTAPAGERSMLKDFIRNEIGYARFMREQAVDFPRIP